MRIEPSRWPGLQFSSRHRPLIWSRRTISSFVSVASNPLCLAGQSFTPSIRAASYSATSPVIPSGLFVRLRYSCASLLAAPSISSMRSASDIISPHIGLNPFKIAMNLSPFPTAPAPVPSPRPPAYRTGRSQPGCPSPRLLRGQPNHRASCSSPWRSRAGLCRS
jgi:hypothetical protein